MNTKLKMISVFEIEIICDITKVVTVTFHRFVSLLNKSKKKKVYE